MITITQTTDSHFNAGANLGGIMRKFAKEGGEIGVKHIRDVLGHDALYQLSETYKRRKLAMLSGADAGSKRRITRFKKLKAFSKPAKRYSGKDADQPLILTAEGIYEALESKQSGNSILFDVKSGHGVERGFDYAEHWAEQTAFLEAAAEDDALSEMSDKLMDMIAEELGL